MGLFKLKFCDESSG